jgi:hypothetical protein
MSIEEFHQMLREMAEGCEKLPNLPTESFTRESFYEDPLVGGQRDVSPFAHRESP